MWGSEINFVCETVVPLPTAYAMMTGDSCSMLLCVLGAQDRIFVHG